MLSPMLQTRRLTLRRFTDSDLDALAVLMHDEQFMRFSRGIFSREQTAAFLERIFAGYRDDAPSQFAVIVRAENKLIGYCGFFRQTVDDVEEIEIGYRLDANYWGQGLATEAARAVRDHAFNDLKARSCYFTHSSRQHRVATRSREERNGSRERNGVPRFSDDCFWNQTISCGW